MTDFLNKSCLLTKPLYTSHLLFVAQYYNYYLHTLFSPPPLPTFNLPSLAEQIHWHVSDALQIYSDESIEFNVLVRYVRYVLISVCTHVHVCVHVYM